MASSINASTSGAGGVITTADNTGILNLQTGGTTAVTVNASQNVGIGTTSPSVKLDVRTNYTGDTSLNLYNEYSGAAYASNVNLIAANTTGSYYNGIVSKNSVGTVTWVIDGGGSASTLAFKTGASSTERMRIASNGYVGINTTNASNPLTVRSGANNLETGVFENTAASGNVYGILNAIGNNGNSTSSFHFAGLTQGVSFWYLYGNGTSSWTSDERKKKNIETTRDGYIDDLCKLRVVKYNWKTDEDTKPKELGLIAQEVEQVFPGLIQDALHEDIDGNTYKTIKGSVLPYMLLKAIQEQQTIINDLKARIETLEGAST